MSKGTFAPVEKPSRLAGRAYRFRNLDGTTVEPNGPLIRNMVAIRVGELPNGGGVDDGTFINEDASGR